MVINYRYGKTVCFAECRTFREIRKKITIEPGRSIWHLREPSGANRIAQTQGLRTWNFGALTRTSTGRFAPFPGESVKTLFERLDSIRCESSATSWMPRLAKPIAMSFLLRRCEYRLIRSLCSSTGRAPDVSVIGLTAGLGAPSQALLMESSTWSRLQSCLLDVDALSSGLTSLLTLGRDVDIDVNTGKRKVDGTRAATRIGATASERWANERFRQTMLLVLEFRLRWPNSSLLSDNDVSLIRTAVDNAVHVATTNGVYELFTILPLSPPIPTPH